MGTYQVFNVMDTHQVFNVMDTQYGCVGNNSHDDTAGLQQAIKDAIAAGGAVFLPPPPVAYRITSPLQIYGNGTQSLIMLGSRSQQYGTNNIIYDGPSNSSIMQIIGMQNCYFSDIGANPNAQTVSNCVVWDQQYSPTYPNASYTRWNKCDVSFNQNPNCIAYRLGMGPNGESNGFNIRWDHCNVGDATSGSGTIAWQIGGSQNYSPLFLSCSFGTSCGVLCGPIQTYNTQTINPADTTITVADTLLFPPSGTLQIGSPPQQVEYTSKSGSDNTLTLMNSLNKTYVPGYSINLYLPISTTNTQTINPTDRTITVADTSSFPPTGTLIIGSPPQQAGYTVGSADTFTLNNSLNNTYVPGTSVNLFLLGVYPGNCSFTFDGGGAGVFSVMGYDFLILQSGYASIKNGQYQSSQAPRRFLQTGQVAAGYTMHVDIDNCGIAGYIPPADGKGVIWHGTYNTTLRITNSSFNTSSTPYDSSNPLLSNYNGRPYGALSMEQCDVGGTFSFHDNQANQRTHFKHVQLSSGGAFVSAVNQDYEPPIVLTDATTSGGTVTIDLSLGTKFLLTMSSSVSTRNLALANANLGIPRFQLFLQQPASGSTCTISAWFSGNTVRWQGGGSAPTLTPTNSAIDIVDFDEPLNGTYLGTPRLDY